MGFEWRRGLGFTDGLHDGFASIADQEPTCGGACAQQPTRGYSVTRREIAQEGRQKRCGKSVGQLRPHVVHDIAIAAEGRDDGRVTDRRAMVTKDGARQHRPHRGNEDWALCHAGMEGGELPVTDSALGSVTRRGFNRLAFSASSIGPQSRMSQTNNNTISSMNQL